MAAKRLSGRRRDNTIMRGSGAPMPAMRKCFVWHGHPAARPDIGFGRPSLDLIGEHLKQLRWRFTDSHRMPDGRARRLGNCLRILANLPVSVGSAVPKCHGSTSGGVSREYCETLSLFDFGRGRLRVRGGGNIRAPAGGGRSCGPGCQGIVARRDLAWRLDFGDQL
jgi:hypothetical protein